MNLNKIYFSSVWEDYQSLRKGLQPNPNDTVISICSSGDNVFNFISDGVKKVYAVDINPAQLALAKLKSKIIYSYVHKQCVEFLKGNENTEFINKEIAKIIQQDIRNFELLNSIDFSKGLNNCGEFEKKLLPILTHLSKKYFKPNDFEKNKSFNKKLNFWIKLLPIIFSFKQTYKLLLPEFPYQYININIGKNYQQNLKNFVKYNDLSNNWYLQEAFFGKYKMYPPFLDLNNFETVKKNLNRIEFIQQDILDFLKQTESNTIDKINLSDIFDWCSPESYKEILVQANRVLKKEGKLFYWELFVTRNLPKEVEDKYKILLEEAEDIHKKDNLPFYYRTVLLKKI